LCLTSVLSSIEFIDSLNIYFLVVAMSYSL
jgi:hypothetical protein